MSDPITRITTSHWGAFSVTAKDGRITQTAPFDADPAPPEIARHVPKAVHHKSRIDQPYIRKGWLEKNEGTVRGEDEFVAVPWDEALDIAAAELDRVRKAHGNGSIFGGSYGWASAGRFHHAQSQVHRFLNGIGGYVSSFASYSTAAAQVIIPHVLGLNFHKMTWGGTSTWNQIADHTDTLVMFGGINPKNAQVSMGGVTEHSVAAQFERFAGLGKRMISISPQRTDSPDVAEWMPIQPGTDVAMMLALAHVLETEGLADSDFLASHCTGYDKFRAYVMGESDGVPKTPDWAQDKCRVPADAIRDLARTLASGRTLVAMSWSMQRARHGEQPYWMAVVLAAMLGQIGLPGGGVGFGYGAIGNVGTSIRRMQGPLFPQGTNPISDFIPVSRITDMLLNGGKPYDFNGQDRIYPDIRLVYWCGGNPFHHHQDLNRLARAWQQPETVIVNEPWWTATAQRADIVFPATTQFEREDIGWAKGDPYLFHMPQMIPPVDQARDDYEIFAAMAERMGTHDTFTEGRSSVEWVEHLYASFARSATQAGIEVPDWEALKSQNVVRMPLDPAGEDEVPFAAFRADPEAHPLGTPSGKIEVFSSKIDSFEYEEVPGHPVFLAPEVSPDFPLRLVSPQPGDKLHSQLQSAIEDGVEGPKTQLDMHPNDAKARGLNAGDHVRVWNGKGVCLAVLHVTTDIMVGVVAMPTGAWFQTGADGTDVSGNPNTLTDDSGTSVLGQGSAAHNVGVEVARANL
jgi:biotin/methionine sulfoxide reductase